MNPRGFNVVFSLVVPVLVLLALLFLSIWGLHRLHDLNGFVHHYEWGKRLFTW